MGERKDKKREKIENAQERVDRLNYVFDKLIVPMLVFVVLFIVVVSVIPKDFTCYGCVKNCSEERAEKKAERESVNFYENRNAITGNISGNREKFESAGWTVRDDLDVNPVAVKTLGDGTIIKEYYDAEYKNRAIIRLERDVSESDGGWTAIVMGVYTRGCISVDVYVSDALFSTVFYNEDFTQWTQGDDFDAGMILRTATPDKLRDILKNYKNCVSELF